MRRFACIWTLYFFLAHLLVAENAAAQPKCKIEYYSAAHGLSHERVTCMLKDREGFMWFGTWNGINRFDGHAFVSYKSSPGDLSRLQNDRIDQMVEDQANHLWLKAYDRQIYRFDKATEQFLPLSTVIDTGSRQKTTFKKILGAANGLVWLESEGDGLFCIPQTGLAPGRFTRYGKGAAADYRLPSDSISFFHEDREHRIWIGTPGGLCCLVRSASGTYKNVVQEPHASGRANFTVAAEDAQHLYFGTADGSLLTYEKRTGKFSRRRIAGGRLRALLRSVKNNCIYATTSAGELLTLSLADGAVTVAGYPSAGFLNTIYEDREGMLWIEPEKPGVVRYDPARRSFQYLLPPNDSLDSFIGNRFWVFEDNSGTVWVKMKGGGFGYYNAAKASVDNFLMGSGVAGHQFSNLVYFMFYDKTGVLWLTTDDRGIIKIIFQGKDFNQKLLVDPGRNKPDNEVRGLAYDRKGRLWLGAKSGKLYVYQAGRPVHDLFVNEPPGGLGQVYAILPDSRGNIWLGTKANGLFRAAPVDGEETRYRLTQYLSDKGRQGSLSSNEIYALLEDRKGRLWIGTFDEGLNRLTGNGDSVRIVAAGPRHNPQGAFRKIRHMALDSAGNIWVGTTEGLLVLDAEDRHPAGHRYAAYRKIPGDKQSLGDNDIQFIYRDSKARMWLATSGGGFGLAIGNRPFSSLTFRNYTTRDGLPNDYILSCAEDGSGNLWIATENGLSRFHPESGTFRNYDGYDGLPKVGFSEAASRRLPDGTVVFGTDNGCLSFHPGRLGRYRIPANIVFTNLQVNNRDAGPGVDGGVLKSNINYVPELVLKYNQDIISIDFALPDHRYGNRQAFAYRLTGFDAAWNNDRQQRRATYTNLPPGHYVFEVKSLSTDLYSNTPYRRLEITILPPPWRTWWAFLLYFIAIVLLAAIIRRNAITLLRLRQKIAVEQKLAALKMSFFTNVSHELRTPLTLIRNPIEQLARTETLSPEGAALVDVVRKNAWRMARFINQLLELRRIQSHKARLHVSRVEMVTLVRKTGDYFAEIARNKRITLQIVPDQDTLHAWVDAEKIDTVLYNLLGNAFKFSPEGKVIRVLIRSFPEEQGCLIEVQDQGPGVDEDKLEHIFELFYEGGQRPGMAGRGTGIGLALARELVTLHGGTIQAVNNTDGGLTVAVRLLLGKDHYRPDAVTFVEAPDVPAEAQKPVVQQLLSKPLHPVAQKGEEAPLVLLVEDDPELCNFLKGQLGAYYRVEVAGDGEEGWRKAVQLVPDLVVSDIIMPVMDGIQMLDKIRNDVNTSHIPVVLLTAKYSVESQIEGLKYGADYYITKPFENEFLVACIENLLRQRKQLFESLVERKKTAVPLAEPIVITSKDEAFLKEVIRVVTQKMTDPGFNIETVAESMAMSRTTFYKKFKSLANMAPVEFVREMRLQRARQYLDAGGHNISEVAYLTGFNNPKYFSTCFKEKFHVSPSEYQKAKETQAGGGGG